MRIPLRTSLAAGAAAVVFLASPALAGPPWISVEYPSNPHHPSTRDALFLVRAYHHTASLDASLTGTAEGIVDGRRRTLPLSVVATSLPGVYAVRGEVPRDGAWVAAITLETDAKSTATALVRLARDGTVASVNVPADRTTDGWMVPRALRPGELEGAVTEAARIALVERTRAGAGYAAAGLAGVPLVLLVVGVLRARRRG
jgi:hypothetical protein